MTASVTLAILLLAAGASSRMRGGDKLMEQVDSAPLIATMARRALPVAPTVIAVPSLTHPRAAALAALGVTLIPVPDADQGMSASIRAGIAALPADSAAMILPADMPEITTRDLITMAQAFAEAPDQIHRATTADGTPGHPVIFPAHMLKDLAKLTGDQGARTLLKTAPITKVPLPGSHATTDLDTPEAWAAWRSRAKAQ
ncbi:NTP transferase domain-containing protein [Pseudooceanicola sp. MF1-13]|uniref:nucleotidyltransferase family protein n=1 Tax=Pseudooceanicola sp. MF1-13 TaxID=3379095 RepID=UPI0038920639